MKALFLTFFVALWITNHRDQAADAYRDGQFRVAFDAFTEVERLEGTAIDAATLQNLALSALQSNQLVAAEWAAERAVARDPQLAGWRHFLFGNASFARCERAALEAGRPEADPFVFDRAMRHAARAAISWQRAAATRDDWPEARRNVSRALKKLEELRQQQQEKKQQRKKERTPEEKESESDPEQDSEQDVEQEANLQDTPGEMTRAEILALLERLARTENEKRDVRRARQMASDRRAERDW